MPPKKKGAAGASPVAKKRLSAPAKRVPAKKWQDAEGTAAKEQAEEATVTAAAAVGGGATAVKLAEAAATEDEVAGTLGKEEAVSGSVARGEAGAVAVKEEGFDDAHGTAERDQTDETPASAVTEDRRDGPAKTAVDVAGSKGEVNEPVGREEAAAVVTKLVVEEGMDAAATAAGLPEKGQAAHVAARAEEAEGAAASAAVECGDAGTAMMAVDDAAAKGDITGSQEEEEVTTGLAGKGESAGVAVRMEVEDEPGAGTPSSTAAADADVDALPVASAVTELPALLPLRMGLPALSISHSVDELRGLSTALSTFIRYWDRLSQHLDSIQASVDALSRVPGAHRPMPTPTTEGKRPQEEMEADEKKKEGAGVGEAEEKDVKDTGGAEQAKKPDQPQKVHPLDLESICEKMLGRNLRRYVVAHMSDVDRLREEVPRALRLAPDPAKLVLSCIGRFYLQGSRAYSDPNSPMVSVRRACILVLEFFLLSGCPFSRGVHSSSPSSNATATDAARMEVAEGKEEPAASVTEEAKVAALAWKNRLVAEGGVASASAVDGLGLALFVASFGIPSDFDSEMMYNVFRLCNMKKKADILRQSPIIVERLPDIIQDLVQKEKYIAAADLACGFGLQEKYPPLDLISSFLIKTNTAAKEERREGQSSMRSLKEATANQLAAYKSVVKCLEDHQLDPSSLVSFKIEEKISKLEKDVSKFEKKLKDKNLKRKAEDVELTNEGKGPAKRPASTLAKATSGSLPPWVKPTLDHGRALSMSRNLYNGSSNRFSGLLDGSGVGNLAGNVLGPTGAGGRLAATAGLFTGSGYSVGNGIWPSAESGAVSYRWRQEGALDDSSLGQSYVGMGHSGHRGLLIGPPSMENLLQLPASPLETGSRPTGSSLYEFADNVMENELYYGRSVRSNALSNSGSGYR